MSTPGAWPKNWWNTLGHWQFKTLGNLRHWDIGVNSTEGPDPPMPSFMFNVSPCVSVDSSRVWEFINMKVLSGVIE
jgi:hypothetical protein